MEEYIPGLLALAGVLAAALVALTLESRRAAGQIRAALFERRYDGYAAVLAELSSVHDWMIQVCGRAGPVILADKDLHEFREEAALRVNRVTSAMQVNALAVDRHGMQGIVAYIGLIHASAELGEPLPTAEELGDRLGRAVTACHVSLSIPDLGRETFREAQRITRHRW